MINFEDIEADTAPLTEEERARLKEIMDREDAKHGRGPHLIASGPIEKPPYWIACKNCTGNLRYLVNELPENKRCPACGNEIQFGETELLTERPEEV